MIRVLLCAAAALVATGCAKRVGEASSAPSGPVLELKLPKYPSGAVYELSSDRGSVVLLDVWATWCEPCKDALPTYEDFAREYGDRGLRVYAINVDADLSQVGKFVAETKLTLPILHDADAAVSEKLLQVSMMPTSFFIDRQGVIRHRHEGIAEGFEQQYRRELEALLSER